MSNDDLSGRNLVTPLRGPRSFRGRTKNGLWLGLSLLIVLVSGCDRNVEDFEPGEEPSAPDLARIFPAPAGEVGNGGGGDEIGNAATGQPARGAVPPARAEAAPANDVAAKAEPIRGVIDISPSLAEARPAGGILFVIARNAGARDGPPLAVVRIAEPTFPLEFSIGPENVMIPTMKFMGTISITARLDADGNAMTRGEGDISSPVQEPLSPGMTDVEILLSEKG